MSDDDIIGKVRHRIGDLTEEKEFVETIVGEEETLVVVLDLVPNVLESSAT